MPTTVRNVRQSITLPADIARRVRKMAASRRVSANRILIELVEDGLEARKRKEAEFFVLAESFRAAKDPKEAAKLEDQLGRMVFGS